MSSARVARATTAARAAGAQSKARAAKREKVEEPPSPVDEEARAAEGPNIEILDQQLDSYMGRGRVPIAPASFGPGDFGFEDPVAERLGRWWLGKILLAPRWDARACCIVFLSAAQRLLGADRRTSASGGAKCVNLGIWAEPIPTFGPERLASGQARPAPKASRPAPKENFATARLRP
jgi:hypothetical protein